MQSTRPRHIRYVRASVYAALIAAIIGIAYAGFSDASNASAAWVEIREFYGLWALAFLIAAMAPGPLIFVLPWLPLKGHLMLARRAFGVSAFVLATLHACTYIGPTAYLNWRQLYSPGTLWIAGLVLGLLLYMDMALLAFTSRDAAVRQLGPQRWKKWHRTVYLLLPLALIHATFLGVDFGLNKGPDVPGEPDAGSLIGMLVAAGTWFLLFYLRRRRIRILATSGRTS